MTAVSVAAGLSDADVAQRIADGKTNDVPTRAARSVTEIVRANVLTRISAILGVLLIIVLSTGSVINGLFGILIVANSAIGIIQELRAKQTLDRLAIVGQAKPLVRRESERAQTGFVRRVMASALPSGLVVGTATFISYLLAYEWWRVGLVAISAVAYVVIFSIPWAWDIVKIDPTNTGLTLMALVIGGIAAALIEVIWWAQGLAVGEKRRLWRSEQPS